MRCLRPLIRFLHATGLAAKNEPHALYFAETIGDNVGLAIDLHKENFPVFVPGQDEIEYMPVICSSKWYLELYLEWIDSVPLVKVEFTLIPERRNLNQIHDNHTSLRGFTI